MLVRSCRGSTNTSFLHSLHEDIWELLFLLVLEHPPSLLALLDYLGLVMPVEWWASIWAAHRALVMKGVLLPKYYMSSAYTHKISPKAYERVIRVSYGTACEFCGEDTVGFIDDTVKKRICSLCKSDLYIGNHELFYVYGLNAHDIVHSWGRFVRFTPLQPSERATDILRSWLFVDRRFPSHVMFFWKPDLDKCYNMETLRKKQRQRTASALLLCAVVRRRYAQTLSVLGLRRNEVKRLEHPYMDRKWYAGSNAKPFESKPPCKLMTQRYSMPFVGETQFHLKLLAERWPDFRSKVQCRFRSKRRQWWSTDHTVCAAGSSALV